MNYVQYKYHYYYMFRLLMLKKCSVFYDNKKIIKISIIIQKYVVITFKAEFSRHIVCLFQRNIIS